MFCSIYVAYVSVLGISQLCVTETLQKVQGHMLWPRQQSCCAYFYTPLSSFSLTLSLSHSLSLSLSQQGRTELFLELHNCVANGEYVCTLFKKGKSEASGRGKIWYSRGFSTFRIDEREKLFKGTVQRKLAGVEIGINRKVFLSRWESGFPPLFFSHIACLLSSRWF